MSDRARISTLLTLRWLARGALAEVTDRAGPANEVERVDEVAICASLLVCLARILASEAAVTDLAFAVPRSRVMKDWTERKCLPIRALVTGRAILTGG